MNKPKLLRNGFRLLLLAVVIVIATQYPKLQIATGYAAKAMATGIFVCDRTPESITENDLNYSIVKYMSSEIDYKNKSVTSSLFGLSSSTAVYRPGFGCALVHESSIEKIKSQRLPHAHSAQKHGYIFADQPSTHLSADQMAQINNGVAYAFGEKEKVDRSTAAVLVLHNNKIVSEQYAEGFDKNTRLWGWSMNKSIISAMVGLMVQDSLMSIDETNLLTSWSSDDRKNISVNNILQMSSGLDWVEDYGDVSTATRMLYMDENSYTSATDVPLRSAPNTEWYYSSGSTNILSGLIRDRLRNDSAYWELPYKRLFDKIGMASMVYETDASGYFVGSSHGYCTARDWARFGLLYLNDGLCNGEQVLAKQWIDYSHTPASTKKGYGAQFWLNQDQHMPDVPVDTYGCYGHRGQRVFVIPSKNLVVIRLGFSQDYFNFNTFLKPIVEAI